MRRSWAWLLMAWPTAAWLACTGEDPDTSPLVGSQGGGCYPNGTCDPSLACVEGTCLMGDGGGAGTSSSGGSSSGGTSSGGPGSDGGTDAARADGGVGPCGPAPPESVGVQCTGNENPCPVGKSCCTQSGMCQVGGACAAGTLIDCESASDCAGGDSCCTLANIDVDAGTCPVKAQSSPGTSCASQCGAGLNKYTLCAGSQACAFGVCTPVDLEVGANGATSIVKIGICL